MSLRVTGSSQRLSVRMPGEGQTLVRQGNELVGADAGAELTFSDGLTKDSETGTITNDLVTGTPVAGLIASMGAGGAHFLGDPAPNGRNILEVEVDGLGKPLEVRTGATLAQCYVRVNSALTISAGPLTLASDQVIDFQSALKIRGLGAGAGGTVGDAADLLAFHGAAPVGRQLMATGAGHTVDDLITALQTKGLFRQS